MSELILIVEDEPKLRALLTELLTDEGFRVDGAADGQEGLDYLVLHDPDLIISDVKMPRVHGLTLVERLRARGHATPVILMSTWVPPDGLPGVRFVPKPFDLDQMMTAVRGSLAGG